MSISAKIRSPYVNVLAALVMSLGAAAPASPSFARGGGGGHAAPFHAAPSVMPQFGSHAEMPVHGGAATQLSSPRADESAARSHEPHHDHHMPPPSKGNPPPTTTTVDTPLDPLSSLPPTTNAAAPDTIPPPASTSTTASTAPRQSDTLNTPTATGGTLVADPNTGGGGDTLAACMSFWKADSHMTTVEWHDTCVRTLNGLDAGGGVTDNLAPTHPVHHAVTARHSTN